MASHVDKAFNESMRRIMGPGWKSVPPSIGTKPREKRAKTYSNRPAPKSKAAPKIHTLPPAPKSKAAPRMHTLPPGVKLRFRCGTHCGHEGHKKKTRPMS